MLIQPPRVSQSPKKRNPLFLLFGVGVAAFIGWYLWDMPMQQEEAFELNKMQNEAAEMAATRYSTMTDTAAMNRCVQAGTVAIAFLQANNDRMYRVWKSNEAEACKAAGISVP